ncbi:alpha-mannosidase [Cohnella mopanensis]|uniref:alpha-mannosidase n=1 Tax=Cohnella mopanensis TaxID=2911966 RepID=UPI001EF9B4A1|nr:alpha-mannosidase [Cohnella mopanensis]
MFWTEEKLTQRLIELEKYRYQDLVKLEEWLFLVDEEQRNGAHPPEQGEWQTVSNGYRWEGRDLYAWLRKKVSVPAEWAGRVALGLFDLGTTGTSHNSGFESLMYVNGVPFQGVDSNHREVFLPDAWVGQEIDICFRLWSGLEGGGEPQIQEHRIRRMDLALLHEAADRLYYLGRAVLETVKQLSDVQPERQKLLKAVNRAFKLIDWSRPGSETFYASVEAAEACLEQEAATWDKSHEVTIRCIGHTHIDVAWLWRLTHTREKAARSFSTVLRLMEKYPEYVFLQAQPQLYEYIKQDYPEIYKQIRERVREGRWEAGGAMWLEADCNLTSGESIVRQILYGTRFFKREFDADCTYLWLPDVFGYSWALPQILKKSGIDTFMTTKISWNQYNRMPHDTFRWRGIDGTEVLTHFVTTPEMPEAAYWWYTYNGQIEPYSVKGIWDSYRDKNVNQELLLSYGYGDGGGGVNRDMLETRRRLDRIPGLPKVTTGRADEYFAKLRETVASTDEYVHVWDGELYLEYHRGTYTSQAFVKRENRKLEQLFREAEWMQTFAALVAGDWSGYSQQSLYEGWKTVLRNQFHDIIPGSSIPEVYADARLEYAEAKRIGQDVWRDGAHAVISADANTWTVFNGSFFARSEPVHIPNGPAADTGRWITTDGAELRAVRDEAGWTVLLENAKPYSATTIRFEAGGRAAAAEEAFAFDGASLTTPHYKIAWNEAGQLMRVYDKAAGREVLAKGERGNVLQVFEDKPKMFEAWDIDLFYQEKRREVQDLRSVELLSCDALSAVVRFEWRYMDSTVIQRMKVYAGSRRIDFETEVDWHEKQQLLKAAFPVDIRATEATYDIQFGNVKRPTHWNTSWDYARFETVGHQWADLSERGYGVSLLNDCKYGHDIKDNVIRLSLIKSATFPDPNADQGRHAFTYSLLPHEGDWVAGRTVQEAWALNQPLTVAAGQAMQQSKSLLRLDRDNVAIDAVKKAEDADAMIVRLHEFTGARVTVNLSSDYRILSWQETDLMERPLGEVRSDGTIVFDCSPYEIKTFLIRMEVC